MSKSLQNKYKFLNLSMPIYDKIVYVLTFNLELVYGKLCKTFEEISIGSRLILHKETMLQSLEN